jgi:hypothetical protein
LLLQRVLVAQYVDRLVDLGDLLEQIPGPVMLEGQVVDLCCVVGADLERDRGVV